MDVRGIRGIRRILRGRDNFRDSEMSQRRCAICLREAENLGSKGLYERTECRVCGRFRISDLLVTIWQSARQQNGGQLAPDAQWLMAYLSAHVRQSAEEVSLGVDNWQELARTHVGKPVGQKVQRLLELIANRSEPAEVVQIDMAELAPLLDAAGQEEVEYLIKALEEKRYLAIRMTGGDGWGDGAKPAVVLTVSGWDAAAPFSGRGVPGTCFVAMSFRPELDEAFKEGIMKAVEDDCGFRVIRVDRIPHNESITDRILAGIRTAQFVVADFTFQTQGAYYEAGFAQGLGRTVVRTCREDDFRQLHFDTRQFYHLKWSSPADLRQRLAEHIRATVTLNARLITG